MDRSKRNTTISDVANGAGVSVTTVSRYLNQRYESMSAETRRKIEAVIEQLEYRPNNLARGLKSKNSRTIGCVVADMASPFASLLIKGINFVCQKNNYNLLIIDADNRPAKEQEAYKSLLNNPIAGIIVNTTGQIDSELLTIAQKVPIVLADRSIQTENAIDTVLTDNDYSTYACIEYLKKQGYRRIGFFTFPVENISTRSSRLQAYKRGMRDFFGRESDADVYLLGRTPAKKAVQQFASQAAGAPSAIFSVNGEVTLEVLQAMRELEMEITPELGLCGYDDWGWAALIGPGITTIMPDTYEIGKKSAELLMRRIKGTYKAGPCTIELKNRFIERGSTKRI